MTGCRALHEDELQNASRRFGKTGRRRETNGRSGCLLALNPCPLNPTPPAVADRDRTNQRLRAERGDVDRLILELEEVDATADAAITRARVRADAILVSARANADRLLDEVAARPATIRVVQRTRAVEDRVVQDARTDEDAALDDARATKSERLLAEREATDQGLLHERAQADEVLATRDEVLNVVGHDLRNFLATILGMAEIIEEDADQTGGAHSTLAYARSDSRAGERMTRLLGDLSDVASIEAGTMSVTREPGDASAIVIEAVEMFEALAADQGVALRVDIEAPLPRALFDLGAHLPGHHQPAEQRPEVHPAWRHGHRAGEGRRQHACASG